MKERLSMIVAFVYLCAGFAPWVLWFGAWGLILGTIGFLVTLDNMR